jgi:hypothetical protein
MRIFRRLAAPQMPRTALALIGSFGTEPSLVRCSMGTRSAMVCTLSWAVASTPIAGDVAMRCRFCSGRRSPRSKIDPRSTKKPSLRCPANTVSPLGSSCTAASARAA